MLIVAIAVGGAIGAVLRYLVSGWALQVWGAGFPYGTLIINVVGSLLAGAIYIILSEKAALDGAIRAFLLIGLLGSFTTFATFSLETLHLLQAGEMVKAALNSVLSVVVCIAAAWLGTVIVRTSMSSV